MIERSCDASGQYFLEPEIELNMFWTNLGESDSEIIPESAKFISPKYTIISHEIYVFCFFFS